MKASDFIAKYIEAKGVNYIFELSGGMITHLLDSISQLTKIELISMHHEQSAAFAADGYARVTGIPGVALATSGPGATNLLTGIASCYFDSSPAVFITGQVNTHEQKGDRPIRQLGFQETDIVSMAAPITKACFSVTKASDIPVILDKAFSIALEGRCGPVLIDIPMDMQRADIHGEINIYKKTNKPDTIFPNTLLSDIRNAKRPLILAGRGINAAFAKSLFLEFTEKTHVPVVMSLLAIDVISFDHPLRVGFIGSYGNRWANLAFGEADLIIVLGSRLDIRQTGADTKFFAGRKIYHIDCEKGEINSRVKDAIPVVADVKDFLQVFMDNTVDEHFVLQNDWLDYVKALRDRWPDTAELNVVGINPNTFMHVLSEASKKAKVILADVGTHQMWAAQSLEISKDQIFLTSGGMGAMGFALPAAIGACFGVDRAPVVVIVGDGCMQLNIQELQTIYRNKLPIKIVVLNNLHLGMIRQFQDSYFESRHQSTFWGYSAPDFTKIAIAYGIDARTISSENNLKGDIDWLWSLENADKPLLLQVMIDPKANAYPKIAFGKPITEMEPFSRPIEMEGT